MHRESNFCLSISESFCNYAFSTLWSMSSFGPTECNSAVSWVGPCVFRLLHAHRNKRIHTWKSPSCCCNGIQLFFFWQLEVQISFFGKLLFPNFCWRRVLFLKVNGENVTFLCVKSGILRDHLCCFFSSHTIVYHNQLANGWSARCLYSQQKLRVQK